MVQYKELITRIAENEEYLAICHKITGGNSLYKDLFQEALIILLEYDNEKIIEIYKRGEIRFFLTRIFTNLYKNKNSIFNRKYLRYEYPNPLNGSVHVLAEEEDYDFEKDKETEIKCSLIKRELKIKDDDDPLWYEKKIFLEYLDKGSIGKLAEHTQINYQSISTTLRNVRKRIKDSYGKK